MFQAQWGNNKDPVANALALSNAILLLLDDESEYDDPNLDALFDAGAKGQDLLATEIFQRVQMYTWIVNARCVL